MELKFRDPFNIKIQVLTAHQIIQSVKPLFYVTGMKTYLLSSEDSYFSHYCLEIHGFLTRVHFASLKMF